MSSTSSSSSTVSGVSVPEKGTEELRVWNAISKEDQTVILRFVRCYFAYRDAQLKGLSGSGSTANDTNAVNESPDKHSDSELIDLLGQLHIQAVKVFPYKCVQHMSFATPRITHHPLFRKFYLPESSPLRGAVPFDALPAPIVEKFDTVNFAAPLSHVRHADLGCCFGTDLRAVLSSGSLQPSQVLGLDVTADFFSLGLQLYSDAKLLGGTDRFAVVDALDEKSVANCTALQQFRSAGGIHSLFCGAVYHVFTLEKTVLLTQNLFSILSPGGVLWGYTAGASATGIGGENGMISGTIEGSKNRDEALRYLHSTKSLTKLLKDNGFIDIVAVEQDWRHVLKNSSGINVQTNKNEGKNNLNEEKEREEKERDQKFKNRALIIFAAKKPLTF